MLEIKVLVFECWGHYGDCYCVHIEKCMCDVVQQSVYI